jgi:hypothetical protein
MPDADEAGGHHTPVRVLDDPGAPVEVDAPEEEADPLLVLLRLAVFGQLKLAR